MDNVVHVAKEGNILIASEKLREGDIVSGSSLGKSLDKVELVIMVIVKVIIYQTVADYSSVVWEIFTEITFLVTFTDGNTVEISVVSMVHVEVGYSLMAIKIKNGISVATEKGSKD